MESELTTAISGILDAQNIVTGGFETPVPGLWLMRTFDRMPPRHMTYRPSLCLIAQGAKQVLIGGRTLRYSGMQSLVVTIEVPVVSQIVEASAERPYIGATLELNTEILLDVVTQLDSNRYGQGGVGFGVAVQNVDSQISGSIARLLELIAQPQAISILYPAIMREISYWLLTGPAGRDVARMVLPTGQPQRIAKSIQHLRENFDTPINVSDLAKIANMSASSFHQHFKALTSMSPLQYQKHLRLLEARRRMVADGEKAGVAAFSVGYESVSQFSREYARMFGAPPRRETQQALADRASSTSAVGSIDASTTAF